MEMFGNVRRMYMCDKLSLHEITKRKGLSRNTVRVWHRNPEEASEPTYRRTLGLGKLSAFHKALELTIKADAHRFKQNRRTAETLLPQIKVDGYEGAY